MAIIEPVSVTAYLESLGNTVEEIAENMRAKGIKGVPVSGHRCALAAALKTEFGEYFSVGIWDVEQVEGNHIVGVSVPTSMAMRQFTLNFDLGKYPDLEESSDHKE